MALIPRRKQRESRSLTPEEEKALDSYREAMRKWMYEDGVWPGTVYDWISWP